MLSWLIILTIGLPWLGALAVMLAGDKRPRAQHALAVLFSVAAGLAVFLAVIATVIGSLAVIFSIDYMRGEASLGRYYAYVLFFIGGMAGLVLTSSLLLLF